MCVGGVSIPTVIADEVLYYPVSWITTKVLLRTNKNGLIHTRNRDKYKEHLKNFSIKFTLDSAQVCKCISEEGLKLLLSRTQQSRLTSDQKKMQNHLHSYLGLSLLPIDYEVDIDHYNEEWIKENDDYTNEIIEYEINNNEGITFRQCAKCMKHYPLTSRFYSPDERRPKGMLTTCVICNGKRKLFKHFDSDKEQAREESTELYDALKLDHVEKTYQAFIDKKIKRLPDSFITKKNLFKIIDYLVKNEKVDMYNFTRQELTKSHRLNRFSPLFNLTDIYAHFFGEDYYLEPWKYPKFSFSDINLTYKLANKVLNSYMEKFNVDSSDPLTLDYSELLRVSKLSKLSHDALYYAVQYNDFKYAGYQFKTNGVNYYKEDANIIFDLKYLIEKDMKIEINKIPLYLTKYVLQKKCLTLYHQIVTKKKQSIYYWINRLYPNKFIEADFDINPYRTKFDSDIESFVHEVLKSEIPNLIYNPRDSEHTIKINGKVPDWFAFTDSGVYIIEYFGLYSDKYSGSSRVNMYIKKMESKIAAYKEVEGYKFLFLYPDDTLDDYKGVREKINMMKEDKNNTML